MSEPKSSAFPVQKGVLRFVCAGWTKHAARYEEKIGRVRALGRGIYLPRDASEESVFRQALDVVAYRYENPRLFGESARRVQNGLSPVVNGVVHIAGAFVEKRRERDLIPGMLKVIRHSDNPDPGVALLFHQQRKQSFQEILPGESRGVRIPGDAEILWDAMTDRTASPSAEDAMALWRGLPEAVRRQLLSHPKGERVLQEWQAEISGLPELPLPSRQTAEVFLQDIPWGRFYDNGFAWRFDRNPNTPEFPASSENLHPFLQSLFPETEGDKHQVPSLFLEEPRRLMNLLIRPEGDGTRPVVNRIPEGADLMHHQTTFGLFNGEWVLPEASELSAFPDGHPAEPKLSGMQPKAPAFLDAHGCLRMSLHEDPFTVLMKFDYEGKSAKLGVPVLEWACQRVARYAGIDTPETALMVDGDGRRAALLSERFDVPRSGDENRIRFAMDGAALLGIPTEAKYRVNVQALWQRIQEVSSNQRTDLSKMGAQLFDRFALAWALADGDLHAKNVSVLFSCHRDDRNGISRYTPWEMRLSPAYDTVCTRAIPGLGNDRMALKIEGKDDGLSPALWDRFGVLLGVADGGARAAGISEKVALGMAAFAQVHPANWGLDGPYAQAVSHLLDRAAAETGRRARYMGVEMDQKVVPGMDEVMRGVGCEALAKSTESISEAEERMEKGGSIEDKKLFNEVRHTPSESPF